VNKILSTSETISALAEVHETLEQFHARRKELTKNAARLAEINRARLDRALAAHEEEYARERGALSARYAAERDQLNARMRGRRDRIARAYVNAKREGLARIAREEDKRKYFVQKGVLEAERREENLLKELEADRQSFERDLAAQNEDLVALGSDARRLLGKFPLLLPALKRPQSLTAEESALEHRALIDSAARLKAQVREEIACLRRSFPAALYRILPIYFVAPVLLIAIAAPFVMGGVAMSGQIQNSEIAAAAVYLVGNILTTLLIRKRAVSMAQAVNKAAAFQGHAPAALESWFARETTRIKREAESRVGDLNREWLQAINEAAIAREQFLPRLDNKQAGVLRRLERWSQSAERRLVDSEKEEMDELERRHAAGKQALVGEHHSGIQSQSARQTADFNSLFTAAQARLSPIAARMVASGVESAAAFPDWKTIATKWEPSSVSRTLVPLGTLQLDVSESDAKDFSLPVRQRVEGAKLTGPLALDFETQGCLAIESDDISRDLAMSVLNTALFRAVTNAAPGQLSLTIFDPVGLGQNFPAFPRLADFECKLLNGQIWTQGEQFEARLMELNLHIERVIQVCLRDEFDDVIHYNAQPGNIAERIHILALADFPANLSDGAARLLMRIVSAGPRCGVFTLLHRNTTDRATDTFNSILEELSKRALSLKINRGVIRVENQPPATTIEMEPPPSGVESQRLLEMIARAHVNATEVRVPFAEVTPSDSEIWSASTAEELRVPIGRAGPNKQQILALGKGTRQHALIAGKTGSGKSTLFHVIVTNLALWCSPQEVEFYLIDFKKGIEFKSYATNKLPHARVIAIESDREFGLSVLQRLDQELRRRGEQFRTAGVQDLAAFRNASKEPMPRTLLLIDEFQEFFTEDDRIAQSASMLLDRIVRQGRAFGIHVILGSQTLGGAYTLARSTLGQMVVRIALQSNEADANLIMDEGNSAARLLSRPGEGIYNDRGGSADANSAFQAVWLSESERDEALTKISGRQSASTYAAPETVVFEGNAPADPRENRALVKLLEGSGAFLKADEPRIWLGAPNSIKGPTEVAFANRSGANLLIVGQAEEATLSIFATALLGLSRQFDARAARFILVDGSRAGALSTELFKKAAADLPPGVDFAEMTIEEAMRHVQQAVAAPDGKRLFLLIHDIQNLRRLRLEDDFSFSSSDEPVEKPPDIFAKALVEGPPLGIHTIASVDTAANMTRFIGRRNLTEFETRVLFQMNANDSAALCDDPRASTLGMHKALLHHTESGAMEIFRPYALPEVMALTGSV
jgi:DNA segregation ATPase FtsK/SpoIIIE, S-DNA-T family